MAESAATLQLPRLGPPPDPRVPVPHRWELGTGVRGVLVPRTALPQIGLKLLLPAGAVHEPAELPGVAAMTARMLTEGTTGRSAEEIARRLDTLGASLHVQAGHDFTELVAVLLSETADEVLELVGELLTEPAFREEELERLRQEAIETLESRYDEPANLADDRAAEALFGPHPYGRLVMGEIASLRAIDADGLRAFHGAHLRPRGAVLIAGGDLEVGRFGERLERALSGWTGAPPPSSRPPPSPPPVPGLRILRREGAAQAEVRVATPGLPRSSADWIPALVANHILGGSTITGRLGANLREDKGWTYGARCHFSAAVDASGWAAEAAVDSQVAEQAVDEILREMGRMVSEPVGEGELSRAREALVLSLPRAFETPGRIVSRFATLEAFGLPLDYWERFPAAVAAVDAAEVQRIARRHFDPQGAVSVLVAPPEEA
jgi:zinc protease